MIPPLTIADRSVANAEASWASVHAISPRLTGGPFAYRVTMAREIIVTREIRIPPPGLNYPTRAYYHLDDRNGVRLEGHSADVRTDGSVVGVVNRLGEATEAMTAKNMTRYEAMVLGRALELASMTEKD